MGLKKRGSNMQKSLMTMRKNKANKLKRKEVKASLNLTRKLGTKNENLYLFSNRGRNTRLYTIQENPSGNKK